MSGGGYIAIELDSQVEVDLGQDNPVVQIEYAPLAETLVMEGGGSGGPGVTDLAWVAANSRITSSTGTYATLTLVDATNPGMMSVAQSNKLAGIEANAKDDQTAAEVPISDAGGLYTATNVETALAEVKALADVPNPPTNLTYDTATASILSSTGTGAQIPVVGVYRGMMSPADKTKLDGIEANAKNDQTAAEVPITDSGSLYTATNVEDALAEVKALADGASSSFNPLLAKGVSIHLNYYTTADGVGSNGFYYPDKSVVDLTGRLCSITWEAPSANIPGAGAGDAAFRAGDVALVQP